MQSLKKHKKEILLFGLFFLVFSLVTNFSVGGGGNDASRIATIESLVERGTFKIDNSPYSFTVDKVKFKGNFYSSKPPVLSFLAAGEYWVLHNVFGLDFSDAPSASNWTYYLLTLFTVGLSAVLLLVFFYRSLAWLDLGSGARLLLTASLGAGTLIFVFGTTFNNHVPAASSLFIGFYFLLRSRFEPRTAKKSLFGAGLFVTLATTFEFTAGAFLILFFFYIISKQNLRQYSLYYLAGCVPFTVLHFILNYQITGDFLPQYFHEEAYIYPGHYFKGNQTGIDALSQPKWLYSLNAFFGTHGLFSYTPLLFFSVWGLLKALRDRTLEFKREAFLVVLGIIPILAYFIFTTTNYGGLSYGMRWFIIFTPLLFFFTGFVFKKSLSRGVLYSFLVLGLYSFLVALIGLVEPWSYPIVEHRWQYFPVLDNLIKFLVSLGKRVQDIF